MVLLSFDLSVTGTYRLRFLVGKTKGAECTGICQHMCTDDASTAIMWVALRNKLLKDFYQKEQKQVSIERFL